MKLTLKALTLAVFSFLVAGQFAAHAQGGFGGGNPNRVMGSVTAIDTTGNTITVQPRGQDATATTVKVTSDTKYTHPVPATITDIAVGSPVTVRSATPAQPGDTSIDATNITILDALPPAPPAGAPAGGYGRRGGTTGTVLTITPSLTIKTAAGDTLTVTTSATTTYSAIKSATLSDIAVGNNVMITTTTDASGNKTATVVAVQPARMRRQGGGGGGGGNGGGGGAAGA